MLRLSLAATWHWTQRPDCTSTNLSIGYWQTARLCPAGIRPRMHGATPDVLRSQPAAGREAVFPGLRLRSPGAGRSGRKKGIAYGYLTEARRLAEQVEEADDRAAPAGRLETVR